MSARWPCISKTFCKLSISCRRYPPATVLTRFVQPPPAFIFVQYSTLEMTIDSGSADMGGDNTVFSHVGLRMALVFTTLHLQIFVKFNFESFHSPFCFNIVLLDKVKQLSCINQYFLNVFKALTIDQDVLNIHCDVASSTEVSLVVVQYFFPMTDCVHLFSVRIPAICYCHRGSSSFSTIHLAVKQIMLCLADGSNKKY